jgi:hypothetical protein
MEISNGGQMVTEKEENPELKGLRILAKMIARMYLKERSNCPKVGQGVEYFLLEQKGGKGDGD